MPTNERDRISITTDIFGLPTDGSSWAIDAACREPDAPSMFVDEWGAGRVGRRRRAAALSVCRRCPVRQECGIQALAEVDSGLCLYGVRCGIEFTDVTPSRQQQDIDRLEAIVARLVELANGPTLLRT